MSITVINFDLVSHGWARLLVVRRGGAFVQCYPVSSASGATRLRWFYVGVYAYLDLPCSRGNGALSQGYRDRAVVA